mgnify:CR=1 FL=1
MYNHRSRGTESKPYPYDAFECSTYKLAGQKRSAACCGHHISTKALRELILETIRAASTFAISDRDAFLEKVRSASQLRQAEAAKETKRKLNKEKKRISELDTIIKKLYESFAVGRITGERFDSLLAEYEAEQKALTASVSEMETQMSAFAEDTDRAKQFLELAKKYTDFSELTTPMINEFVEKIIVHAPEKIDGDRVQEVEIYLRFIGRFELPVTELTEEEIKRQEQLKRHRIKSRERYQKIKAGEHAVGQPFMLTCKCCGQEFASKRTNTLFCGPNCRAKFYRQEAAELYGIDVNRYGKALCPFHNDRHPSLYVADDHYYCFACGEHGDVIDFVGRLFQLSPYNAARKLMADFHLSPDKPPSAAALHAKRIRTEAQQLMENERLCFSVLSDYARVLRDWKMRYTPQSPDVPVHAWFVEACHKLDQAEYYLDILCAGDSFERAEVVQQQMAGGKLDRLRQRLEKIHKEEIEDGYDTAGVA